MASEPPESRDDSIDRFCRQYLQLEWELDYPPTTLLREADVQDTLYHRLFADGALSYPPPQRYQLRVLKELMSRIEASIDDWDRHVRNQPFSHKNIFISILAMQSWLILTMFRASRTT